MDHDMVKRMEIPTVSIVLPTHNRAKQLKVSIQSVLSQSYDNFELIVVDDASSDNTYEVVMGFFDARIHYLRCDNNVGGGQARNIGIRKARADIIAFQDSDDEWRCQKLETCLSILRKDETLDGVFSGFWQINGGRVRYMPNIAVPSSSESMYKALLWNNFVDTPTVVARASILERIGGFDPRMPRYQDWELFLRLTEIGKFHFVKEALILSYCTPGSISTDMIAHKEALSIIYDNNQSVISENQSLLAMWLSNIGDAQIMAHEPTEGRKNLLRAALIKPSNARYLVKAIFAAPGNTTIYQRLKKYFQKRW